MRELFTIFTEEPELLPDEWREDALRAVSAELRARIVADYIAGMTDRYARREWKRIGGVL